MSSNNEPIVTEYHSPPPTHDRKVAMTVMWGDVRRAYKVMSIQNTTWYRPGIWLSEEIVAKVCLLDNWTVTCLADDMWTNMLTFIGGKLPGVPTI